MKAGWETSTLGRMCSVIAGQSPEGQFYNSAGIGLPFFQGKKDFQDKYIGSARVWTSKVTKEAQSGDILMSVRAPVGPINFATEVCCIGRGLAAIRAGAGLDADYLYYVLLSKESEISGSEGAVFASINKSEIEHIAIPVPPLDEQRRIVAVLDKAFAGIATATANAQKNLTNARALFESYLNGALAEPSKPSKRARLADLCSKGRIITYGVIKLGDETPDGVPCLRTSNVRWLHIDQTGMKRIEPALSDQYRRTILEGGEVLVNVRGTLGGVAVATKEMAGWNVSREVAVVPVDTKSTLSKYLAYWIGRKESQDWLTGVQKGAAYSGINIADLRELSVDVPSMAQQQEIVDRLSNAQSKCNDLARMTERKLAALAELKQSLLQKAFTGDLT